MEETTVHFFIVIVHPAGFVLLLIISSIGFRCGRIRTLQNQNDN